MPVAHAEAHDIHTLARLVAQRGERCGVDRDLHVVVLGELLRRGAARLESALQVVAAAGGGEFDIGRGQVDLDGPGADRAGGLEDVAGQFNRRVGAVGALVHGRQFAGCRDGCRQQQPGDGVMNARSMHGSLLARERLREVRAQLRGRLRRRRPCECRPGR